MELGEKPVHKIVLSAGSVNFPGSCAFSVPWAIAGRHRRTSSSQRPVFSRLGTLPSWGTGAALLRPPLEVCDKGRHQLHLPPGQALENDRELFGHQELDRAG